jgi:aflatoxin B1 aldehyde reductase
MTFGEAGKEQARVHDLETVNAILDIFQSHGHYEVLQYVENRPKF